ncbi:MAG: hypothetical protein ACK5Y2_09665 [Bdellovibrionales bacterium]
MWKHVFAFLLMVGPTWANFSRGNAFDYVNLVGRLTISCTNQRTVVDCRETFMEPWPYDFFVGPQVPRAHTVELRAQTSAEAQVATASYNGATGRSGEFNLGIYSILSKPLLRPGRNTIRYTIFDRNNGLLDQGQFVANVGRLPTRSCPARETSSVNDEDCEHTYSICQQYFKAVNYCR